MEGTKPGLCRQTDWCKILAWLLTLLPSISPLVIATKIYLSRKKDSTYFM